MKNLILVVSALFFVSCHPLMIFNPKAIKVSPKLANDAQLSRGKIRISIDGMGLPYIKATSMHDAMYGMGFMHARDRLFQIDLMRHAALGKTAELFGERSIALDKKLRILTYRLDEQIEHLSDEENVLLEHYTQGVNDGALQRGKTAEHFLLGLSFEPLTKRDVIAIARLQSWQLGADLYAEIARLKIARTKLSDDVKAELLASPQDRGAAILRSSLRYVEIFKLPPYISSTNSKLLFPSSSDELVQTTNGASNAWVINSALSKGGTAMLMNDPHLQHTSPSNFYLVTLETDAEFVTGATFPGLPGVLIGSSKSLAWGVTASTLNTQDAVLLRIAPDDPKSYIVDKTKFALLEWPQQFCTNKKGTCQDVMYFSTMFGPVLDETHDKSIDHGDYLAVQWTGFHVELHHAPSSGFLTLARMQNVSEGINAVEAMSLPGVNMVLADTAGNIGYAYAGLVPKRDSVQHPYLPLDGGRSSSKWTQFLPKGAGPSAINPSDGYLVTANQNIFSHDAPADLAFGKQGAAPYRALRIRERIDAMIKSHGLIDFDELSDVQLDSTSYEAKELAPLVGALCVAQFADADEYRQNFARFVRTFDGNYTKESLQALPYEMLMNEIVATYVKTKFGEDEPLSSSYLIQTRYIIKNALLNSLQGRTTALFAQTGDAEKMIQSACEAGYQSVVKKASKQTASWRWGRHHVLKRQSLLAKAPFVGGFFRDKKREVAGTRDAPMAESGLPVIYGANLRFRVKMSTPPEIYAVLDSGNSGTPGHKNALDQAELWHEGKALRMAVDWEEARKKSITYFELDRMTTQAKN